MLHEANQVASMRDEVINEIEIWNQIGNTYSVLENYDEATKAFENGMFLMMLCLLYLIIILQHCQFIQNIVKYTPIWAIY